jgi:L-ascorbate metabolism protein UlaG (beta-lactamase superfamily)
MRLRRLGWAGLELEAGVQSLVIDHLLDPGILSAFFGDHRDELIGPEPGRAAAALVTHLHRDHTDVAAIERALVDGGTVLRPPRKALEFEFDEIATGESDAAFAASDLDVRASSPGDSYEIGGFKITALRASDGLGSSQVSWLIEADSQSVVHGGDTVWHGGWWDVVAAHGPVDLAFLPGNGVEIDYPGLQPAVGVPSVMTPEQAVEAARALQAGSLVPIHYNRTFEHPKYYRPVVDARERIERHADSRGMEVSFLEPGEWVEVADLLARTDGGQLGDLQADVAHRTEANPA